MKKYGISFLDNIAVHDSWLDFIQRDSILQYLLAIEAAVGVDYTPHADHALRFLSLDLSSFLVVILGQDPYPQPGVATGRCFEVGGLTDWSEKFKQTSLRNILRAIYSASHEIQPAPSLKEIREKIKTGEFNILPPDTLFKNWENQGVLLLNTAFTCCVDAANSHKEIWAGFTNALLSYISAANPDLIWFLWGKHAQAYRKIISGSRFYACDHPMMAGKNSPSDFLCCPCFSETDGLINWAGV